MEKNKQFPLFIFEMANNHMGDIDHGIRIIREFGAVAAKFPFRFAFKLQYRNLETFIHPLKKKREDIKYVKRFSETELSSEQFQQFIDEMRLNNFLAMATPFDEPSVDMIDSQQLDIIKIASCSFTDWPLLERVVRSSQPVIASTAGASMEEIERVVSFFVHRNREIALMHCVGEYPTPVERMNLARIDTLKSHFPDLEIGFSTHENPEDVDIVKLAVAKGATIFEKHVAISTEKYSVNKYSATPVQAEKWLEAAQRALNICGTADRAIVLNPAEQASLRSLRRGIFARHPLKPGDVLQTDNIYFAFPPDTDQYTANDWSKYVQCTATTDIPADAAISPDNAELLDLREEILDIAHKARALLDQGGITFPGCTDLEISHHYGINKFWEYGLTMLTIVNRAYCKKLLIVFPGQKHPEQYHKEKEETFHVLYGSVLLELDGQQRLCQPGDVVTVDPGVRHAFESTDGAVIEEISSTHFLNDSFYSDPSIDVNKNRKTLLSHWLE